jgi:ATP-dependent protease ClpP protease subunit
LGNVRRIDVHINSPGGSVFEATAIYNALKDHRAQVVVQIDGAALSAATIVAMAGDEILIAGNALMMVHSPLSLSGGNAEALRKDAELLDRVENSMLGIYAARTRLPTDRLRAMLRAETWMDAGEAVQFGFADRIVRNLAVAAHVDLSKFQNVPTRFQAADKLAATKRWYTAVALYMRDDGLTRPKAIRKLQAELPELQEAMRAEAFANPKAYNAFIRTQ